MAYKLDYLILGNVATNCYLLINTDNSEAVLFDPADSPERIKELMERNNCVLKGIFLTHGHFDHITAAKAVREESGAKIYAGEQEKQVLASPELNLSGIMGNVNVSIEADIWLKDEQEVKVAGFTVVAKHTPGHTEGGMSYYVEEAGALFSGDTLFAESVGRTDFPTGSMSQIVNSIKTKLFVLPDSTKVFPGHGESTSIAYEKEHNPFCV